MRVTAFGTGNSAINIGGANNVLRAGLGNAPAKFSNAFNMFGSNNFVTAGPGPFATAGTVGVNNHNGLGANPPAVTQTGPRFNVKSTLNP